MARQEIIFDPPESMQDALTKVNENFDELYSNPVKTQLTKSTNFNVLPSVDEYFIDLTTNNVTATFQIDLYGKRNVSFIIKAGAVYDFIIDEVSGTPTVIGNPVPYNTGLTSFNSITVTNDGSNFYIK